MRRLQLQNISMKGIDMCGRVMSMLIIPKNMNKIAICFMLLFAGIGVASATIAGTPPNPTGDTDIYDTTTWKDEYITLSGNVVIHAGGSLTLDNTTLIFASTSSVNYGTFVKKGSPAGGRFKIINGSNVTAWNPYNPTFIYAEYGYPPSLKSPVIHAKDSYYSDMGLPGWGAYAGIEIRHTTNESYFDNLSIDDSVYGIYIGADAGGEPVNITNCTMENIDKAAVFTKYVGAYVYNNNITNMQFAVYAQYTDGLRIIGNTFDAAQHSGNYVVDIMGENKIYPENMDRNFLVSDNEFKNFQRGIVLAWGVRDGIIRNNTFTNANGGGIIINRCAYNLTIQNNTLDDLQEAIDFNINAADEIDNVSLIENTIINPRNNGMELCAFHNSVNKNNTLTSTNPSNHGIQFVESLTGAISNNVTFSNTTISGFKYGLSLKKLYNSMFIDLSISDSGSHDILFNGSNTNNIFINTLYNPSKIYFNNNNDVFIPYHYLDVKVEDSSGNPVQDVTVTITNDVDISYPSININGESKTSFMTGADGHTSLPSDPVNSAAILDFWQTKTEKGEMSYTITAKKDGNSNSITVNPDGSWYRSDPNMYQNTVTIVLETGADTTLPTITAHSPTGTSVPINSTITATFNEPMKTSSAEDAFSVSSVAGTFSWIGNAMTFTPGMDLSYETTYTVTLYPAASDLAGNHMKSAYIWQFTTETAPDTTPPAITGVGASDVTSSTAVITWTTDESATSQLEYGLNAGYGSSTSLDTNLVTSHSVTLTGLSGNITYHYRVKSMDAADNLAVSGDHTFTTLPNGEPDTPEWWSYYVGTGEGIWGRTETEAHSGDYSAFLKGVAYSSSDSLNIGLIAGKSNGYTGSDAYAALPNTTYNFSFWMKGDFTRIRVSAMYWNTDAAEIGDRGFVSLLGWITPTDTWMKYEGTFTMPADARKFVLFFQASGNSTQENLGTIYVDDVDVNMGEGILSTGINCAFFIGGTKLIQPTNKDSAPCLHYGFRDLKKLKLWRCEV